MELKKHILSPLLLAFVLGCGACDKKSPMRPPIVDRFETKHPITAFYDVSQVVATDYYHGVTEGTSSPSTVCSWTLQVPIGSERYSSKHHAEKYHRLYQQRDRKSVV